MQQFASILYFLPCIVCLLWLVIYCFRVKTTTQRLMVVLLMLGVYYFTTYAFYISPWTDYRVMAILDMCNVPVIMLILVVDLIFLWTHHSRSLLQSRWRFLLYVPVLMLSSANFLLYYMLGFDQVSLFNAAFDHYGSYPPGFDDAIYSFFRLFNTTMLRYVELAYIIVLFYACIRLSLREGYCPGDVIRFFFRGHETTSTRAVCLLNFLTLVFLMPLVGLGRTYLINHPGLGGTFSILVSVALFLLLYVEYLIDIPLFTLRSLSHIQLMSAAPSADVLDDVPIGDETAGEESEVEDAPIVPSTPDFIASHAHLVKAVRRAFDEQKVYLDSCLSIQSLASRLSTNRTTLSLVIGQLYGTTFRQLVARYRIDEAKRYMLAKPETKQEVIALDCGFATAQAFNQKFKELEGDAPHAWLVKHSNRANVTA